jgi:hypothetical protein
VTPVSDRLTDGNEEEDESDRPLPDYFPFSDKLLDDDAGP